MHTFFKQDRKVTDILKEKDFVFSFEIVPPRNGVDPEGIKQAAELLKSHASFASVTHGAGGSLRGGTMPICFYLKEEYGFTAVAHLTCREYSEQAMENVLIDHEYLGIRNILALRGDAPIGAEEYIVKENHYQFAYQLVEQISKLNRGEYLVRKGVDKGDVRRAARTDFCIGVASYPEEEKGVEYLQEKIKRGAHFSITQMIVDVKNYLTFRDKFKDFPIIPGIRVFRSLSQALKMKELFGIQIPDDLMIQLENASEEDQAKISLAHFINVKETLKKEKAPGMHFFILNDPQSAFEVMKA